MLTTHDHHVFVALMESKTINLTIKYVCSYIITLDTVLILQPTLCRQLYVNKQMITSPDSLSIVVNTKFYVFYCHKVEQILMIDAKMMYTYMTRLFHYLWFQIDNKLANGYTWRMIWYFTFTLVRKIMKQCYGIIQTFWITETPIFSGSDWYW